MLKSQDALSRKLWPEGPPRDQWQSFDSTPWLHPWLTRHNLRAMREASARWREEARRVIERADRVPSRFAFVGNMANGTYMRAKAVARPDVQIEIFGLLGEGSVFADPRWEEYDGALPAGASYLYGDNAFLAGIQPKLPFHQLAATGEWATLQPEDLPSYARLADFQRWPERFSDLLAFDEMQRFDALVAAQQPHVAYMSGKPYAVTVTGGDWWLEASRDDALGRLQRTSYGEAGCVCVSNPWNYSHARRYGLANLLYLPLVLNEEDYSPGPPSERERWRAESGGEFFVFSSARADEYYKGSNVGLRGFAEFSRRHPEARLVLTTWGNDFDKTKETISRLGLTDRVLLVPLSGKRKLVEYLRSADCLLDQFKVGYFGATGLEACACGLPVIIRFEEAQYADFCETGAPPFLNAATTTEVANALEMLATDPGRRAQLAADHRDWFLKNQSGKRWAADYQAVLGALALGHKFSFETSPLGEELSAAERLYHAEQLAAAPGFPAYEPATATLEAKARLRERIREKQRDIDTLSLQLERTTAQLAVTSAERDATAAGLAQTSARLAQTAARLAQTAAELAQANAVIGQGQAALANTQALVTAVSAERDTLARYGAELAASLATTELKRQSLERTLDSIYHSTSWRLTKPLRALVNYARKRQSSARGPC